jgi:hypothetical protein
MVFPSNGLQGEFIITPQGQTRVNNKALGNMFSQKNRGTKVSIQSPPATAGVVVIPTANLPSSPTSGSFPYPVKDANSVSYTITKMVTTNPENSTWNYYMPADSNGNFFLFGDTSNYGTVNAYASNSIGNSYTSSYTPTLISFPGPTNTKYTLVSGFLQAIAFPNGSTGYANIYQLVPVASS